MTQPVLLIDNYDSFVYNLARYLAELGCDTCVVRNDAVTIDAIRQSPPAAIVLSPGPCTPADSGVCEEVVTQFGADVPILGVCLGHQAIATALGGRLLRADEPMHGRTSLVHHDRQRLFEGLPVPLVAARYHSLIVDETALPNSLSVTARTGDGIIMALEHREWPLFGVQFHPESILTTDGHRLLNNFLLLAGIDSQLPADAEKDTRSENLDDFFARPFEPAPPLPLPATS